DVVDGSQIVVRHGRQLTVKVDGKKHTYWTNAHTVAGAMRQLDLRFEHAELSSSRSSRIPRQGMALRVTTPKHLTVSIGAKKPRKVTVAALTAPQVLHKMHVTWDDKDKVTPGKHHI